MKFRISDILTDTLLTECGKSASTLNELASNLSDSTGKEITHDALFGAHKRNKRRLNLKDSLTEYFGVEPERKKAQAKPKPPKPEDIKFEIGADRREALAKATRFVITSALNNSQVDPAVWASIKIYAARNNAEIIVLPVRYRNPTNRVDGKIVDEGAWWPEEVLPYMADELVELHEHCWLMGHVRVQATASDPLTGLDTLSRSASGVFAHPQLRMKMVPTPQSKLPKILYTTGTVSEPNYSTTKAGVVGDHHHGKGAVVVEVDGPRFHIRALIADDDGAFYDVDRYYHPKGSRKAKALALVTGDEHAMFNDPVCRAATYLDKDSIVSTVKPEFIVRHDVFDGYSISHHGRKNPVTQISKHRSGRHLVADELQLTVDYINDTTPSWATNLIVSSNHHDHLLQWMRETTPLDEPWNADTWIDLWAEFKATIVAGPGGAEHADPFAMWALPKLPNTEFLGGDSDRTIAGIAVGNHGHRGSNGSRGSIRQFTKIGVKSVIGHSHTPGVMHGVVQVGTSSMLNLEYTGGMSSWVHAHCIIHANGKRQLVIVNDGHWRL